MSKLYLFLIKIVNIFFYVIYLNSILFLSSNSELLTLSLGNNKDENFPWSLTDKLNRRFQPKLSFEKASFSENEHFSINRNQTFYDLNTANNHFAAKKPESNKSS